MIPIRSNGREKSTGTQLVRQNVLSPLTWPLAGPAEMLAAIRKSIEELDAKKSKGTQLIKTECLVHADSVAEHSAKSTYFFPSPQYQEGLRPRRDLLSSKKKRG